MPAIKRCYRSFSRQRWLGRVLSITFTIAIIVFLLAKTDISGMWKMVAGTTPVWLLVACIPFLLNRMSRAAQYLILTGLPPRDWLWMTAISCAQSLTIQIFPARTGELSYIWFVRRNREVSIGSGVTSLLVVRLLDILAIAGLFLVVSVLSLDSLPKEAEMYVFIAVIVMVILIIIVLALIILHGSFCRSGIQLLESHLLSWIPWRPQLVKLIVEIDHSLLVLRSGRQIGALVILSLMFWILMFGLNHILLLALNLDIDIRQTVIGSTFGAFTSLIPIGAIGNLGTMEVGWTAGFLLVGLDIQTSVFSGFAVHILSLLYSTIFGLTGLAFIRQCRLDNNQDSKGGIA